MEYAEKKVLIDKKDFDALLNQGPFRTDPILDAPNVTSVKLQQLNDNFIKEKTRKKNQKDVEWNRLASRLQPIISPLYNPVPNNTANEPISPANTTLNNSADQEADIVDYLDEKIANNQRNKAQRLYRILLSHPNEIRVTKLRIYVNDQQLPGTTLSIIKNLIGRSRTLSYNVDKLLDVIATDPGTENLIGNWQALQYIQKQSGPNLTSTPGAWVKKKASKSKSGSESKSGSDSKSSESSESPILKELFRTDESLTSSDSMTDVTDSLLSDLDATMVPKQKGSGKRKSLKWLRMF